MGNTGKTLAEGAWTAQLLAHTHCACGTPFGRYRYIDITGRQYCLACRWVQKGPPLPVERDGQLIPLDITDDGENHRESPRMVNRR